MSVFESELRLFVQQEIRRAIKEMHDDQRHGEMGHLERSDADAHHHVPLPPRVFEGGRIQPGPIGGRGNPFGSGGVHPGSCESEHRMLDGGAPRQEVRDEDSSIKGYWDPVEYHLPQDTRKETPTHDMIFVVGRPLDAWAALVLEHEHEGFSVSDMGRSACGLYDWIRRELDTAFPNWRTIWASRPKSSR